MTPALLIAFLSAILTDAPELINEVDKLVQDFKGVKAPAANGEAAALMKEEVDAAMAPVAAELSAPPSP